MTNPFVNVPLTGEVINSMIWLLAKVAPVARLMVKAAPPSAVVPVADYVLKLVPLA